MDTSPANKKESLMTDNSAYKVQSMMTPAMPEKTPSPYTTCSDKFPQQFFCISCQKNQISRVETSWGLGSSFWAVLCIPTVILPLLPCCVDILRDKKHYCPMCQESVGKSNMCGLCC